MAATTTRGAFPYPTGGDNWKQLRLQVKALADQSALISALYQEGTAAARPAAGVSGRFYRATDTGVVTFDTGAAWLQINPVTKTFRVPHTFTISGAVAVPSGDTSFIPPFFVPVPSGQTVKLVAVRHRINSGTSVTCDVQVNGAGATGFTGLSVTTTSATTDPADVTLADGDRVALVVTAVSGSPQNMTVTLYLEYTV